MRARILQVTGIEALLRGIRRRGEMVPIGIRLT